MLTYTKYLLAILAINMFLQTKAGNIKEVIYKNYSFAQLKGYLGGKWILIDSASNDTLLTPFTFTYKPKSDTSGYMNPTTRLEYGVKIKMIILFNIPLICLLLTVNFIR
jgi:hypothetical protein